MGAPGLQRCLAACSADLRVAVPQAQRDHPVEKRLTRHTMINDNPQLAASRGSAYAAAIPITNQNRFAQPAEVFLILPPERVAGRRVARGKDLLIPAPTIKCPLYTRFHCSSSPRTPRLMPVSTQPSFGVPSRVRLRRRGAFPSGWARWPAQLVWQNSLREWNSSIRARTLSLSEYLIMSSRGRTDRCRLSTTRPPGSARAAQVQYIAKANHDRPLSSHGNRRSTSTDALSDGSSLLLAGD